MARAAEPAQPVLHVGRVARLAHLAVVHDGDARLDLLPHGLRHRVTDPASERRRLDRHAFLLREHHANEICRTRQTAAVRREESVRASLHRGLLRVRSRARVSETATLYREQRVPEPRIVRTQADGFLTRRLRFLPTCLSPERLAEARVGLRVIRLQVDGLSICHLAVGMLALLLERRPEIEAGLAVLWPQVQRLPIRRLRLREQALREQRIAQEAMGCGAMRLDRDGLAVRLGRLAMSPLLTQQL